MTSPHEDAAALVDWMDSQVKGLFKKKKILEQEMLLVQYLVPACIYFRRRELADAVAIFAKLNRQELFAKSKSLDMGFGVIGFRASTRIVQLRGVTAEMTLERLHQYNLADGIRVKEEINKDAALGWPDERLELVGLKRQQADTFFIEIARDDVPGNA